MNILDNVFFMFAYFIYWDIIFIISTACLFLMWCTFIYVNNIEKKMYVEFILMLSFPINTDNDRSDQFEIFK